AYCANHHQEALNAYWKNPERVEKLGGKYMELDLSQRELLLCKYARELTQTPQSFGSNSNIEPLRNAGLDDRAILDATLVVAYFNFVNRIVLSLGVDLENDKGAGYKY
ncbi:MAG: peroxidase-related enzyme, partial [Tenuifilaceae bacterium]|nr:peroxidase-related enzyme [Tenuifilaceae bacterium]